MTTIRLLAIALLFITAIATPASAHPESPDSPLLVYDESLHQLIPLRPDTLAPLPDVAVPFGDKVSAWSFARSADGATLVNLDDAHPHAFTVRDGQTGQERLQVDTELTVSSPVLSADGARLLVDLPMESRGWALFDAVTGNQISKFAAPEGWVDPVATSPDLSRLYYLTIPTNDPLFDGESEPHPELVAIDLATGVEIGRVLLPEIGSGILPEEEAQAADDIAHAGTPGIAVSPDGARIAVVRADRSGFTLVNAASLSIERTESISEPRSSLNRLLTWLSILPQSASAKMIDADVISAAFSPDASHLYVWGFHITPEPDEGREVSYGNGLLVIDLATGEIAAAGPKDQLIIRLASDGDALYITGPTSDKAIYSWIPSASLAEFNVPHYLHRLDPDSLTVEASQEFPDPIWLSAPVRST
jgi:hypothetical protein